MSTSVRSDFVASIQSRIGTCVRTTLSTPLLSLAALFSITQIDAAQPSDPGALVDLSLEELAGIQVVSASKSVQTVAEAPASIFVITERDIRRSGSTTLPEALRLAPNLQVARANARDYAVAARGFISVRTNKMLVMIDGRTIYSPLFSGVFWDAQDVVLEDLDRIEVVSGPGGTTWGANAVNGVINIITRSASNTQGGLVSIGASEHEQHGAARYGASLGDDGHYRVYAKHSRHDDTYTAEGMNTETGWERSQAGFRADWDENGETLTLQGDAYTGRLHQPDAGDIEIAGANILGRKRWNLSPSSTFRMQAYFDHTERDQPRAFHQKLGTLDLELEHEWTVIEDHHLVWGGGYRYARDRIDDLERFTLLPNDRDLHWWNLFVQDEIAVADDLRLTLGIKLEDSPFTQWQAMPSAQLAWQPDSSKLLWSSLSRALRSPSRLNVDFFAPKNPPVANGVLQYEFAGGPDFESEIADVFELGYRSQPTPEVSWSITGFYSDYHRLRTIDPNPEGPGFIFANRGKAKSYGVESWASWQLRSNWRVHGGLVLQHIDISLTPDSEDIFGTTGVQNGDPDYYGILRSSYDISDEITFDATLRHTAELEAYDIPAYTSLDLRLAWTIRPNLELSLLGKDLLDDSHPEFGTEPGRSEYQRAIFGELVWRP